MEDESQAIEGYGCQCGYKTDDLNNLRRHLMEGGRKDGKGTHKSLGRINLITGDVILPVWTERTSHEKSSTQFGVHKGTSASGGGGTIATPNRITDNLTEASEIKFVPRVYTATLSPIMQTAFVAAQRVWHWRADMPFINFLDTVIYNFFKEHGITLAAYIVADGGNGHGNGDGNGGNGDGEVKGSPDGTPENPEVLTQPLAPPVGQEPPPSDTGTTNFSLGIEKILEDNIKEAS